MATDPRTTLSWRIGAHNYESDETFDCLLAFLGNFRSIVDEVALFETVTHHLYLPLDSLEERFSLISRRLAALREQGVPSVGIDIMTTIGHFSEARDYMPAQPFQPMVGHDGGVSSGCACPNTPEFRAYVRAKYTLAAQAGPDFIWADDDIRMQNHGIAYGCFCPTCLAIFAQEAGVSFDREGLVRAFNDPDQRAVREAWVDHNIRTLEDLLADIAATIRAVDPRIATGLMTAGPGWTTYSGQAFDRWFPALGASKARPGESFYHDDSRVKILTKALEVGRQRASLPPSVADCQYELENFPYQVLRKAASSVVNECTLALGVGLNGVAANVLPWGGMSFEDCRRLMRRLSQVRPLWERLVAHADGLPTVGLWPAYTMRYMARRKVRPGQDWLGENWFEPSPQYDINRPNILAEIGLPLCVDYPGCATVLAGRIAEAFSDEELEAMLAGGVLMDTAALQTLTERGLDHLAGVRLAHSYDNGVMERFADDPLNGEYAGEIRDARIEFWSAASGSSEPGGSGLGDTLEATAPGVRVLAAMEDYFRRPRGACLTAFENARGGRVAVMGYAPWMLFYSGAKRCQMLNIADWISRGSVPVRIQETLPLVPFVRLSSDRRQGAVVLLNLGLDPIETARLHVRAPETPVYLAAPDGCSQLPQQPGPDGWSVTLDNIGPWTTVCLLLGEMDGM